MEAYVGVVEHLVEAALILGIIHEVRVFVVAWLFAGKF